MHASELSKTARPKTALLLIAHGSRQAEANADLVAGSGMFDPPIDAGPGAPDDVRLLGLLGRRA